MFCEKCGAEVPDGVKFCPKCGHDLSAVSITKQPASSSTADSIKYTWNSWGTGKKVIAIIVACCIGLFIMGSIMSILSPDANTSSSSYDSSSVDDAESQQIKEDMKFKYSDNDDSSSSSSSSSDSDDGVGDASLQVKVITSGSWQGSVGTASKQKSVSGSGTQVINLDGSGWDIASAVIQKQKGDNSKLTVQLIKDGNVKAEESTTAAYGVVSVSD